MTFPIAPISPHPSLTRRPDRTREGGAPLGDGVTVFSERGLKANGFSRRISLAVRRGNPAVLVEAFLNGERVGFILIGKLDAPKITRAIALATESTDEKLRRGTGSIARPNGESFAVRAIRYRKDRGQVMPGVSFQLVGRDNRELGNPKTLIGDEFEALGRACVALLNSEGKGTPSDSR